MNKESIIEVKEKNEDQKKEEEYNLLKSNEIKDMNSKKYIKEKDLILILLNASFRSLSNLELNNESQLKTLKSIGNNLTDGLNLLTNLKNEMEEKEKKEIEKKMKLFKHSRKLGNETNILKFRNKNFKDIANKTISNFNNINNKSKEKEERTKKLTNFGKNTQQNFRKKNNTQIRTPMKKQEKDKNEKTYIIYEKDKTFTNKLFGNKIKAFKNNKIKSEKRGLSKSFTKNPMSNNKEENENSFIKQKKDKKNIKGMLYKNIKKHVKMDNTLFTIDEKSNKNTSKKNVATKNNEIKNEKDGLKPEERIKLQEKEIEKLSEELKKYKKKANLLEKDNRKGIFVINQNKNVIISTNLITVINEIILEVKAEPLQYYDNYYYLMDYKLEKTKKKVYVDDAIFEETKLEIINDYQINIQLEKTYNGQTRKIKVIQEIINEFMNYSYYSIKLEESGALTKYVIKTIDDIQIDDVTNKFFKKDIKNDYVCFEGKITNEILVNKGEVIYSKKINYYIYDFIPEFKPRELDIIKIKESTNEITSNIIAIYKKVIITDYGQDIEVIYKIKMSNYLAGNYVSKISYPLMLDTKYEIDLVELNGKKIEYNEDDSTISILNFGAFNNQFAEIHLKYRYITVNEKQITRNESIITSNIKNSFCKLIIEIPDNYVVLSTNDIFQKDKKKNNRYYYNDVSKEEKLYEIIKLSIKTGIWDINKEVTLNSKDNIEKCCYQVSRIFKGGNLKEEFYEIIKENAEFEEDKKNNTFIFKYNNINNNKIMINWKIKVKNSTSNYIANKNNDFLVIIPESDEKFFKELSDNILKEDKSNFPLYKKLGKWVYNYMNYNLLLTGRKMTAKEIYDKKFGVCEHYTLLYNTLLVSQGIKVIKVSGYALENKDIHDNNPIDDKKNTLEDNRHCWTLALIDGTWVPLDATWNLFEKSVPIGHIFQNYGNSSTTITSSVGNSVEDEISKEIIKFIG